MKATMANIEKIERVLTKTGIVYLRNAVVLAYFIDKPVHKIGDQISAALDTYLKLIPKDCLKWVISNSSSGSWIPFSNRRIAICKKQLEASSIKARDMTSFRLSSHGAEAPNFQFCFVGKPKQGFPNSNSLLQMIFPIEMVGADRVDEFFQAILSLSKNLSFHSGYCSPSLLYPPNQPCEAYQELCNLALRHPGYDVAENMLAAWTMAGKIRGARWVTLLGTKPLEALGGKEFLRKKFDDSISIIEIGDGVLIRAGQSPELGDVDKQVDTPLLRSLAEALRPVSHFGDKHLIFVYGGYDYASLKRWEERFF
jgi:hypothetical protein